MNYLINKNIELLYGLNYCINRERGTIKIYNTREFNDLINNFYKIYKENINEDIKNKIISLGDYEKIAIYALEHKRIDFIDISIFDEYFNELDKIKEKVIKDISHKNGVDKIDLNSLKEFYGFNLSNEVNIILSMFISGGFGPFLNNSSNIILGVKYAKNKDEYGVCGTAVCKIYHEFSHPYINKIIKDNNLKLVNNYNLKYDCYDENQIEETLVRVMELIYSSFIFGNEYLKWAIFTQEKEGFENIKEFIKIYFDNKNNINNIDDYIKLLIDNNLLKNN